MISFYILILLLSLSRASTMCTDLVNLSYKGKDITINDLNSPYIWESIKHSYINEGINDAMSFAIASSILASRLVIQDNYAEIFCFNVTVDPNVRCIDQIKNLSGKYKSAMLPSANEIVCNIVDYYKTIDKKNIYN